MLPPTRPVAVEEHYNIVTRRIAHFLSGFDILLTPTNTRLPLPIDAHRLDAPAATFDDLFNHLGLFETFTALFSATGHPALSLPIGQSRGGLPIGVQFVSGFGQEAKLLRLAAELEAAVAWNSRRPPIHVANSALPV
jgi:amidase